MGKTSVVREYLKKRKIGYTYVQAEDDDFFECLATAGEGVTGTARGDRNGYSITLQDTSLEMPYEVKAEIVTDLVG